MKINGTDPQAKLNVYQAARVLGPASDTPAAERRTIALSWMDRVEFTDQGQLAAEAQRAIADIPDIRQSLVEKIQNDLLSGAYTVDTMATAEGILRESLVNQAAMGW